MRNRSLVSPGLLKSGLKRFWPLWLAGFAALMLLVVVPLYSAVTSILRDYSALEDRLAAVEGTWTVLHLEAWVFALIAAAIVAVATNEQLFDSRAATFVGSLPLRRTTVFVTHFLTGLLPLVVVPAIAALCMLPLRTIVGPVFSLIGIARWYLLIELLIFCFYAFAQLACQLAGTRAVAVLLYGVVNFLAITLDAAVQLVISALMYGLGTGGFVAEWLSPGAWLLTNAIGGTNSTPAWSSLGIYALASVAIVALSGILFVRRDLESANDSIAFAPVRPVLKYLNGISMALLFSSVFCTIRLDDGLPATATDAAWLSVMLVIGGSLGILFAEMIMSRSAHVLGKCWRGALVVSALAIAFVCACYFDVFDVAHYVPEPDEVERVTINLSLADNEATFASPNNVATVCALHRDIIAFGGRGKDQSGYMQAVLRYQLAGGRYVERQYELPSCFYQYLDGEMPADEGTLLIERLIELEDTAEGRASRFSSVLDDRPKDLSFELEYRSSADVDEYRSITLTPAESIELIEGGLRKDLMEEAAGQTYDNNTEGGLDATLYGFARTQESSEPQQMFYLQLNTNDTPNTLAWIRDRYDGIELLAW